MERREKIEIILEQVRRRPGSRRLRPTPSRQCRSNLLFPYAYVCRCAWHWPRLISSAHRFSAKRSPPSSSRRRTLTYVHITVTSLSCHEIAVIRLVRTYWDVNRSVHIFPIGIGAQACLLQVHAVDRRARNKVLLSYCSCSLSSEHYSCWPNNTVMKHLSFTLTLIPSYLDMCTYHQAIYDTPSIQADPTLKTNTLRDMVGFLLSSQLCRF